MLSRIKKWFAPGPRRLGSVDAYALWAATYPPYAHNPLMEIEQAAMVILMPDLAGRAVLDLACGSGRYALIARQANAQTVVGADNSLAMLRKGVGAGLASRLVEASMPHLPFAARCFDVVLCGLAVGHLPDSAMRQAMAEVGRVLKPGGEALFSDFHPFLYLSGRRRTFTSGGVEYSVEHYPHLISDYFAAAQEAGLVITGLAEPQRDVGGESVPAVLVFRCRLAAN